MRLQDQASTLVELLHYDTSYPAGSRVLEAGGGVAGVRESVIKTGIIELSIFDQGIRDLYRTTEPDGVFCYTFFKAIGSKGLSNKELLQTRVKSGTTSRHSTRPVRKTIQVR